MTIKQITTKLALKAFARISLRSVGFSVALLSLLTQSPSVYSQTDRRLDNYWYRENVTGTIYRYRNRVYPNLCLGVKGADTPSPGSLVEVFNCESVPNDPRRDQHWIRDLLNDYVTTNNGIRYQVFYLRNRLDFGPNRTPLCLGVKGIDNHSAGTGAEVYYCNPVAGDNRLDSRWYFETVGPDLPSNPNARYFRIRNRQSHLCLGVRGADNYSAGAEVEVYHC